MNDHMYMVLPPDIDNLEDLELWKSKYDSMTYYQRKMSNDISIDVFGQDNITRYNKLKTKFLNRIDPNKDLGDIYISPEDTKLSIEEILNSLDESSSSIEISTPNDWEDKIIKIKKAESDGLIIIIDPDKGFEEEYPEESITKLKEKWKLFQGLSFDKRQLSNDTAKNILGVDNYSLYDMILNKHIKRLNSESNSPEEENPVSDIENTRDIAAPYFTPYELGSEFKSTDPIKEAGGVYQWSRLLETLYVELESTYNLKRREKIKESIMDLGWNPEIPFSLDIASKTWIRNTAFSEVTDFRKNYINEALSPAIEDIPKDIAYEKLKDKIVPVFVVLISGRDRAISSNSIKWFTDSQWSHASIGFDSSLKILYSFNLYMDKLGLTNGFSIEGIDLYRKQNKDMRIKVFSLFCTPKQRDVMVDTISWYIENQNKTKYDFGNIFNIATRRKNHTEDKDKMICSQFVYSILKLANFRIKTTKTANSITPDDIDKLANDERFYCMYEGELKNYRSGIIDNMIKKIIITLPLEQFDINENSILIDRLIKESKLI